MGADLLPPPRGPSAAVGCSPFNVVLGQKLRPGPVVPREPLTYCRWSWHQSRRIGIGHWQSRPPRPPVQVREMVLAWRHDSLHQDEKGIVQRSRRRGSDRGKNSLPSRITTQRVTSVVVVSSRDHTHRRAQSTKVLPATSTRSPEPHHKRLHPQVLCAVGCEAANLLTGRFFLFDSHR